MKMLPIFRSIGVMSAFFIVVQRRRLVDRRYKRPELLGIYRNCRPPGTLVPTKHTNLLCRYCESGGPMTEKVIEMLKHWMVGSCFDTSLDKI